MGLTNNAHTVATRSDDVQRAPVLSHGAALRDCQICGTTLADDEPCPSGCRLSHRGRRQAPRARFHELSDPEYLDAIGVRALQGTLQATVVA